MKKKEFNLTKEKDRELALRQLESDCLNEFTKAGFELCPFAILRLNERSVDIGIIESDKSSGHFGYTAFGSEITFYSQEKEADYFNRKNEVNYGTTGAFDPSCKEAYWRAIHAASLLKNWQKACDICNTYCRKYKELMRQVEEAMKPIEAEA